VTWVSFHISNPTWQALPEYLEENNYQNTTGGHCAWHKSANTDLDFFPWAKENPQILTYFQQLMSIMGLPKDGSWLDVISITNQQDSSRKVFVDIAGSIGHQCSRLLSRHPDLGGRVILQDLEETFQHAPKIEGVEFMVHDFFKVQPVKGKKHPSLVFSVGIFADY
jgi:demethylsterigmatocystin 6-O-methyltransferase